MNVVMMSPHFPTNFINFSVQLRQVGATVLGIADAPYDMLDGRLRDALTEYYRVSDMHNYDELVRALGYFTHRYGKIDRLESHNEYWLETDARLRTDFNIFGVKTDWLDNIKCKSLMKKLYQEAGVPVARGRVIYSRDEAYGFLAEVGYPVVVKPDSGVGAARTYKLASDADFEEFWAEKPEEVDYIMEEFVEGDIVSFDGLTDRHGNVVFFASNEFSQGVMDTVNKDLDIYYITQRQISP
ncbi:MAG: ATP-grasp domain-containing protein, partial [Negativicutes bacterium]|nr:ATP-grasp domain-containing protein [Negativicutes bacterium]